MYIIYIYITCVYNTVHAAGVWKDARLSFVLTSVTSVTMRGWVRVGGWRRSCTHARMSSLVFSLAPRPRSHPHFFFPLQFCRERHEERAGAFISLPQGVFPGTRSFSVRVCVNVNWPQVQRDCNAISEFFNAEATGFTGSPRAL